jgi:hypothetical protein
MAAEGLREGLRYGLRDAEALAPGSPCKCTPLSPACYLTTPPPRCDSVWWSGSPWGWLSISRGIPGLAVNLEEVDVEKKERKEEDKTATAETKADDRGLRLEGCAWTRNVIATAIDQRSGLLGSCGERVGEDAR